VQLVAGAVLLRPWRMALHLSCAWCGRSVTWYASVAIETTLGVLAVCEPCYDDPARCSVVEDDLADVSSCVHVDDETPTHPDPGRPGVLPLPDRGVAGRDVGRAPQ